MSKVSTSNSSRGVARLARAAGRTVGRASARGALDWLRGARRRRGGPGPAAVRRRAYPGDFDGIPDVRYAPEHDGSPDPGEVVWTWVPFEEDHARGKDRPVLVVGHDGPWLLGLMLTSKDHDGDATAEADERRWGREWLDIGAGTWDPRGRPSEVRLDRILRLDPAAVRREGAVLSRERFDEVAAAVRAAHRADSPRATLRAETPKGPLTGR